MTARTNVYMHSRNGGMTKEEYWNLCDQLHAAEKRGDEKEYDRLLRIIPLNASAAKAAKETWGKEFIISSGFDVTEANIKYGERWLDE
jgi:hypothetical protein